MFKIKELEIPKDEVLRYLGYKSHKIDENLNELIDEAIEECKNIIKPKIVFGKYNNHTDETGVIIDRTSLVLEGEDIKNHLLFAKECVIMAATIGSEIEKKISLYQKINLTRAMILDSCATTAIEEVCDKFEEYIKEETYKKDLAITFRYSPGYGDLSLDIQKDLINILRADKIIGLTVSCHNLLFPGKSVTAIIGLIPKDKEVKQKGCEVCKNYQNCSFRREGHICGS